jgi:hypothetical protein
MNFVYPTFLFALSAVSIPIIIHFFNFRKFQTVYFSNVQFLKEIQHRSNTRSNLKNILVLIARILFILFLVFAVSQPYIPSEITIGSGENTSVSVFIDNSFSMESVNKNGTLLDEAKKRAREIANHYSNSTLFQIITNDFEGYNQRLVNKADFLKMLDDIKISSSTKPISEIILRQKDALNNAPDNIQPNNKVAYVISDFQQSITDLNKLNNDSSIHVFFIPANATERTNIYVDSCWFENPAHRYNQTEYLHVRLKNTSENKIENAPIKLYINNTPKAPATYSIDKDSEAEIIFSFINTKNKNAGNIQHCRVELNDNPVTFDDKYYFSYSVLEKISILCINNKSTPQGSIYLNKLFSTDSLFIINNISENKIDYASLSAYNMIILNEVQSIPSGLAQGLTQYINNGNNVLIFPAATIEYASYKEFLLSITGEYIKDLDTLRTKVEKINEEHPIFKDVFGKRIKNGQNIDLPEVYKHYTIDQNIKSKADNLLQLQNGAMFLNQYSIGKGNMFLSTVPLNNEFSNFQKHALFVPTIYKIALYYSGSNPLSYSIGTNTALEFANIQSTEGVFHIKGNNSKFDFIPEQKNTDLKLQLLEHNQIKIADNYSLLINRDTLSGFSFNYNRSESNLKCFTDDELKESLATNGISSISVIENENKKVNESLTEIGQEKKLWKICIILALLFLAIEVVLLRFMNGQKSI